MQYIDETLADLTKARERLDSVIVSYSGGKDSLVVADLCLRTFKHVEFFFMEFVPGLSMSDEVVEDAKKRWGVTVRRYLHWSAINAIADSVYCDGWKKQIKKATLTDIYTQVRRDTGLETIATGAKRADGIWRKRVMASSKSTGDVLWPIAGWQKAHILAYLHTRKIPVPDSEGSNANGVDLNAIADSVYCDGWKKKIKKATLTDIYTQVRRDTGLEAIATGAKRADGIWRRRVMASSKSTGDVLWPIAGWQKAHILAYLHTRKIPVPDSEGSNANGVDLSVPSLLWLFDKHPDDFRRLLHVFPYAQAVVERRRFYPDWNAKGRGRRAEDPRAGALDAEGDPSVAAQGGGVQPARDHSRREAEAPRDPQEERPPPAADVERAKRQHRRRSPASDSARRAQ